MVVFFVLFSLRAFKRTRFVGAFLNQARGRKPAGITRQEGNRCTL